MTTLDGVDFGDEGVDHVDQLGHGGRLGIGGGGEVGDHGFEAVGSGNHMVRKFGVAWVHLVVCLVDAGVAGGIWGEVDFVSVIVEMVVRLRFS